MLQGWAGFSVGRGVLKPPCQRERGRLKSKIMSTKVYVAGPMVSYNINLKQRARDNRNNMPAPEKKLWFEVLSNRKLKGFKFLRQKLVDNFILDFYCSKLLLAIEVDGDSHADQEAYDQRRTEILNKMGIKVVRYWNNEVMGNIEGVYDDLERVVNERERELKNLGADFSTSVET